LLFGERFALEKHVLDRVNVDATSYSLEVVTATAYETNEDVSKLRSFASAYIEVDCYSIKLDTLEESLDVAIREFLCVQAETERGYAFVQDVKRFSVRFACILGSANVLTDSPLVVGSSTAHVRELTWCRYGSLKTLEVLLTVVRLYVEAF
jgi:hypothetical protein